MIYNKPTAIDLFCGSGAVTEGLKQAGFSVLAGVDCDSVACQTFRLNHPEVHLEEKDIREVVPAELRKSIPHSQNIDLMVVCAPCQPFSSHNRKKSEEDPRIQLVLDSLRFAAEFLPSCILYENVRGIATIGPLAELRVGLEELGYTLSSPHYVDAADLGVPQRRERCVLIASRLPSLAEGFSGEAIRQPKRTVRDAISHLLPLCAGQHDKNDPMHFARQHRPITLNRLKHIPKDGGSRDSLPSRLVLDCHVGRDGDFPDVLGRLAWDQVAPTLTTGCTDVTKGRYAHPEQDRAITLREAAALQTFPPAYRFYGNHTQIARQIGNAVPVAMAERIAHYLLGQLRLPLSLPEASA